MYYLHPLFRCTSCSKPVVGSQLFCIGDKTHTQMNETIDAIYDAHGNKGSVEVRLLDSPHVNRTGHFRMPDPHKCDSETTGFLAHVGYKSVLHIKE